MPRFRVFLTNTISTAVEVEADNEDDAYDKAYNELPSTSVMFLTHDYPDMGDWIPDEDGIELLED